VHRSFAEDAQEEKPELAVRQVRKRRGSEDIRLHGGRDISRYT